MKDYHLYRVRNIENDFWIEGSYFGTAWAFIQGTQGKTKEEAERNLKFLLQEEK